MNTKQEIKDIINKHKNYLKYDPLVNDLCRLYFELESLDYKESPFEGSQLKVKSFYAQDLFQLGFFEGDKENEFCYNVYGMVLSIFLGASNKIVIRDLKRNIEIEPQYPSLETIQDVKNIIYYLFSVKS